MSTSIETKRRLGAATKPGQDIPGAKEETPASERRTRAKSVIDKSDMTPGDPRAILDQAASGENTEWVERRAKLFECGEYSDRGLNVSPDHLQKMAMNFDAPVPVLIEHTESPFRLGYLTDVEALGPELFGTLSLTKEANDLIETSGSKSLSISVANSLDKIYEVSIVGNPRVESARLFCENFRDETTSNRWKLEALQLRQRIDKEETEKCVASFGLPPAVKSKAIALLEAASEASIKERTLALLSALPKLLHFGELAPSGPATSHDLTAEEAHFYAEHFPGIDPRDIAKRR